MSYLLPFLFYAITSIILLQNTIKNNKSVINTSYLYIINNGNKIFTLSLKP